MKLVERYRGRQVFEYPIKQGVAYTGKDENGHVCRDVECSHRYIDRQIETQKRHFDEFMASRKAKLQKT